MNNVLDKVAEHVEPILRDAGRLLPGESAPRASRTNDGVAHLRFGGSRAQAWGSTLSLTFETGEEMRLICGSPDYLFEQTVACLLTGRTTKEFPVGVGLSRYYHPVPTQATDRDWTYLTRDILFGETEVWDFEAPYQRPYVWSEAQKEEFIGHVLEGGSVPLLYVHEEWRDDRFVTEVVDGKQRLNAISLFITGEVAAKLSDGTRFYYSELNERERQHQAMSSRVVTLTGLTLQERMKFYLRLNDSGVRHTEADLDKVKRLLND